MKRLLWHFSLVALLAGFCISAAQSQTPAAPKLTVVIVIDQMRPDHFTRFEKIYKHGFARLYQDGAVFLNGQQYHAQTVTGAGHGAISSGCYPSRSGVVGNNWFDRTTGKYVYCCEDQDVSPVGQTQGSGRSPKQFRAGGLSNWLKKAHPEAKVFGVGRKDRAAILMGGQKADAAYWYESSTGNMVSSTYYLKSYPQWVRDFNASRMIDRYFEAGWQKLMPEETYKLAREDAFSAEADGERTTFPHLFKTSSGKPDKSYYRALSGTPFSDEHVIKFAQEVIKQEGLGVDDIPDVLCIGCSAADGIGHTYGPFSQESMDHFLRLDQYLGEFFTFLDETIGAENYVVALSSDHGVLPLPEELQRRGVDSKRVNAREMQLTFKKISGEIASELGVEGELLLGLSGNGILLNYDPLKPYGIAKGTLDEMFVKKLKMLDEIADVFTKDELGKNNSNDRPFLELYRNSYHPERTGDLMLRLKKHYLVAGSHGTSHGSPYDYDTFVPIVFYGAGVPAKQHERKIKTVDIAPTLAALMRIKVRSKIDGRNLLKSIRAGD